MSDPIIFGHCVSVYFKELFAKHAAAFEKIKVNPNNGFQSVVTKIGKLSEAEQKEILADIEACYNSRPGLAMVNSAKGITNLHVPSDVIIDASMPNVVRDGGMMWNKDDKVSTAECFQP